MRLLVSFVGVVGLTLVGLGAAASPAGAATGCVAVLRVLHLCVAAPAATTTSGYYLSMEDGIPPAVAAQLDPAYAPPLAIDRQPSTTTPSTPADPTAACGGATPVKADGTAWRCTFSDEFSGSSLDRSKWTPQLTAQTSFGTGSGTSVACYVDNPNTVSVSGGALNLTVRKERLPFACKTGGGSFATLFTAGGVTGLGKFSQTYGRFDVRAAFPAAVLAGLQSSLWLWPDNALKYGPWPASGEIDLAEYYTSRPGFVVPTVHYLPDGTADTSKGINTTSNSFCHFDQPGKFHDYTLIWTRDLLSIYYDGTLCMFDHWSPAHLSAPAPFDSPFFLTLTAGLGVGSNAYTAGTPLPATTRVDYVRTYN